MLTFAVPLTSDSRPLGLWCRFLLCLRWNILGLVCNLVQHGSHIVLRYVAGCLLTQAGKKYNYITLLILVQVCNRGRNLMPDVVSKTTQKDYIM